MKEIAHKILKRQTIPQAIVLLMITRVISLPLGFATQIAIAALFGATYLTDTFFFAQSIIGLVSGSTVGLLPMVFMPEFIRTRETESENKAWDLFNVVFTASILVILTICLLLLVFASPLTNLFSDFPPEQHELVTRLFMFLLPVLLLTGLYELRISVLHSYQHFVIPAVTRLLGGVAIIGALLLLARFISIYSLATGTVVAIVIQFAIVSLYLRKTIRGSKFKLDFRNPKLILLLSLFWPLFLAQAFIFVDQIVFRFIATGLAEGSLSALTYAQNTLNILHSILIFPVGTALFPLFSLRAAQTDLKDFGNQLMRSINSLWFMIIPASVIVVVLSQPLIRLAFQRGAFDEGAALFTAGALSFFAIGFFTQGASFLVSKTWFSLQDTLTPMKIGIIIVLFRIPTYFFAAKAMSHEGLALTVSVFAILAFPVSLFFLNRKLKTIDFKKLGISFVKISLASLGAGLAAKFAYVQIASMVAGTSIWNQILELLLSLIIFLVLYLLLSYILKSDELPILTGIIKRSYHTLITFVRSK